MKEIIPVLVVFVLIVVGGLLFITRNNQESSQENQAEKTELQEQTTSLLSKKLIIGNTDAPAKIVEYFDYKCPSCNNFHYSTNQEIVDNYISKNLAHYEIRMTPIIGPDSATAARGAYCAADQGLFSEYHETVIAYMHDNYYEQGNFAAEFDDILSVNTLQSLVEPLGADVASFASCTESDLYNPNLDDNLNAAADDSIRGTPGFTIGDQSFVGNQPFSVFKTLIELEI
jgi:protein-disulfide isomerase